jgi:hypothetical protein
MGLSHTPDSNQQLEDIMQAYRFNSRFMTKNINLIIFYEIKKPLSNLKKLICRITKRIKLIIWNLWKRIKLIIWNLWKRIKLIIWNLWMLAQPLVILYPHATPVETRMA